MRESQIHDAFMAWLKKQGLLYVHSTFGKKATMTKDMPDFIILHAGRCLLVECKTEKGALTPGQHAKFAEIQIHSGMVVQIARTVEQAVSAVETWLGVEKPEIQPPARAGEVLGERLSGGRESLWVAGLYGFDHVFSGDPSPGGLATKVRRATAEDIRNIPRR